MILDAAAQVLVEQGFERATTNGIASRAGVSIGSLYQYFPNKEAVVAALFDRLSEKAVRLYQDRLKEIARAPLRQAIHDAISGAVELYRSAPELVGMGMDRLNDLGRENQYRGVREKFVTILMAFLQSRKAEIRDGDLPHMAWVTASAMESVLMRVLREKPDYLSTDRLLGETAELIGRYLER